ncbi:MAG TPA: hypothetical protein PKC43_00430 [Phycisphaerales bacterium]|nr:hypothetical protein [Phycisphaerales bacterium]HMP35891.1 hypothetical protein [Phycisphaerales bacterium]
MARGARRGGDDSPATFFSFQDLMMATIGVIMVVTLILVLHVVASPLRVTSVPSDRPERVDLRELERRRDELRALEAMLTALPEPEATVAARRAERRAIEGDLDLARLRIEALHAQLRTLAEAAGGRPAVLDVVELMRLRDELEGELGDLRRRSRIVYIVDKAERPPRIIEVSGGRIVISSTSPEEPPMAIDAREPELRARLVIEAIRSDRRWRERYPLIVLKPSGLATWRAIEAAIAADPALSAHGTGLDLIAEDQATTDQFPAGELFESPAGESDPRGARRPAGSGSDGARGGAPEGPRSPASPTGTGAPPDAPSAGSPPARGGAR